jgi:hypothetical protein
MKLKIVPARQGALWVRQGFRVFFRHPLAFSGLFAAFLFGVFVLTLLPWIGSLLLLAVLPFTSLGFMLATREALAGRWPAPRSFIEPLRAGPGQRMALLKLGLIYAAASFAIMTVSEFVDGGALEALMQALADRATNATDIATRLADPRLEAGIVLRLTLAAALSVPFWHAPALVHLDRQGPAQALFSSTVACWRNRGAFLVYGLVWVAVILLYGLLANLVFALLGQMQLLALAAMPASLIFSTVFYAGLYFTFADSFELPADTSAAPVPEGT